MQQLKMLCLISGNNLLLIAILYNPLIYLSLGLWPTLWTCVHFDHWTHINYVELQLSTN